MSEVFGVREYADPLAIAREFAEIRERFNAMDERIEEMDTRLKKMDDHLKKMDNRLDKLQTDFETGFATLKSLIEALGVQNPLSSSVHGPSSDERGSEDILPTSSIQPASWETAPSSLVQHRSRPPSVQRSSTPTSIHEGGPDTVLSPPIRCPSRPPSVEGYLATSSVHEGGPIPSLPDVLPPPSLSSGSPSPSVECSHSSFPVFHVSVASNDDVGPSVVHAWPTISTPSINLHATQGSKSAQKQSSIGRLKKLASKLLLRSLKNHTK